VDYLVAAAAAAVVAQICQVKLQHSAKKTQC
jgi:hypothetical protein